MTWEAGLTRNIPLTRMQAELSGDGGRSGRGEQERTQESS